MVETGDSIGSEHLMDQLCLFSCDALRHGRRFIPLVPRGCLKSMESVQKENSIQFYAIWTI
jgi:hypothetical protein